PFSPGVFNRPGRINRGVCSKTDPVHPTCIACSASGLACIFPGFWRRVRSFRRSEQLHGGICRHAWSSCNGNAERCCETSAPWASHNGCDEHECYSTGG